MIERPGGAPEGPGGALLFLGTSKSDFADFVSLFFQFFTDFDGF